VTRFRLLLALACVLALAAPFAVGAEEPADDCRLADSDDPDSTELCRSQAWFVPAETKVGNLGAFGLTGLPTWTDEEPAQSVTEGAGGGYHGNFAVDIVYPTSPEAGVTFEGTHTGPLDAIGVTLHAFLPQKNVSGAGTHGFTTELIVDDEPIVFASGPHDVTITPAGDAVFEMQLAFTDLLRDIEAYVGTGPDTEHTIRLNVTPYYSTDNAIYVYGTTEVPGGLVFNPTAEEIEGLFTLRP
jgi:hypothetical protein